MLSLAASKEQSSISIPRDGDFLDDHIEDILAGMPGLSVMTKLCPKRGGHAPISPEFPSIAVNVNVRVIVDVFFCYGVSLSSRRSG